MAGILVKGSKIYTYEKAVRGSSFIRLYDANGFCFQSFLDISSEGFDDYVNYVLTKDTSADSSKTYYTFDGTTVKVGSYSASAYEALPLEYDVPVVTGIGTVAAKVGAFEDAKLSLTLPAGIYAQSGMVVNFKTPVSSAELTYVTIEDRNYELVDASGYTVSAYHKFAFVADSIVSIVLDLEANKACVQNLKFSGKVKVSITEPEVNEDIDVWIDPNGSTLIVDETVESGSSNLVTSGAVYSHVNNTIANLNIDFETKMFTITSDSWSDNTYTYTDTEIKENGILSLQNNISITERTAAELAMIEITSQSETQIVLTAKGEITPDVDIPLMLLMF